MNREASCHLIRVLRDQRFFTILRRATGGATATRAARVSRRVGRQRSGRKLGQKQWLSVQCGGIWRAESAGLYMQRGAIVRANLLAEKGSPDNNQS